MFFMNRKKRRKLSRAEKIAEGYKHKYKVIIPGIFILIFIIATIMINRIKNENIKNNVNDISTAKQHAVYSSVMISKDEIESKADSLYPDKCKREIQLRQYRQYVGKKQNLAAEFITEHFDITMKDYGKIVLRGNNENWTINNN
jgi:hypothetical protein